MTQRRPHSWLLGHCPATLEFMQQVVLRDWIWAEGRGPVLRRIYYTHTQLKALEYLNPDWSSEADVRHLLFHKVQVSMFTPHEVYSYHRDEIKWGPAIDQAAVVNLGRSDWLLGFAQLHLERCNHYRIMFYDEFLDVICEDISAGQGPYTRWPVIDPPKN
jgi:hypothetical protein